MNLKTFVCPICGKEEKLQLGKFHKVRRCENCHRVVRVIAAPKKKKQ